MLFLSCKANARVKLAKSRHGPHLFRIIVCCVVLVIVLCYCIYAVLLLLCCTVICVALLLFVLSYVLIVCTVPLPPGVNQNAVDKYRVIHKSLRDFRPLRYSSRDGHTEGEHVNRERDTPSFCPTLQVLDMCTLGDF